MRTKRRKKQPLMDTVTEGLERLAFGKANDAVRLLQLVDNPDYNEIGELELDTVTSVKRDKGGGMEIHFADRLRALELLHVLATEQQDKTSARSLLEALRGEGETE